MAGWRVGSGWEVGSNQDQDYVRVEGGGRKSLRNKSLWSSPTPGRWARALRVFSGLACLPSLWGCPARLRGLFLWKVP